MSALFVTGTGTDIGKTFVSAALLRALTAQGLTIEVSKPVVSGFDLNSPAGSDPAELLQAIGQPVTTETLTLVSPWQFAAPLSPPLAARLEGRQLDFKPVLEHCRDRVAAGRPLLIEGAGGVMSPLSDDSTMLDLAAGLSLPVLLVAGSYLGTISHTLTALLALRSAGVGVLAVAVSESLDAPDLDETVQSLIRLEPEAPVIPVRRGAAAPDRLVELVRAALA
jgi:dethiobiotin synthetase